MNKYELTVVLDGKTTPAKKKTFRELLEKLIKIAKGKMVKPEEWGVIGTGLYLHYILELESGQVKGIATKLNQEAIVVRHLLVWREA